ncbi:pyroglutamyl peptidase [Streptomyces sp. YIM 98790]|uniref:pyroglutamyl peptidase n=1 Tax=Streptomyces sp. YIM 98790 TaxID=2689077 RepID=UPI001A9EF01A|nr:pyroglutamyl peptidase [Streptomyces sp. YIM 98790]
MPQRILRHGGLADAVPSLEKALGNAGTPQEALRTVRRHGLVLWRNAVRKLRETDGDDRPLYWTRLAMRRALRAWRPGFDADIPHLITELEYASRGMTGNHLPAGDERLRLVITGFDPFRLERDIRRGNPSGAAALALDGAAMRLPDGRTAHVAAVLLPVRWADFAAGIVERALRPYLEPGPRQVALFLTISQGQPGAFHLERYNAAWRGGGTDNAGEESAGAVPVDDPATAPQWTVTSLPYQAMAAAGSGRFPVVDNTAVQELPGQAEEPVMRADGPSGEPGAAARAGGGGAYLSNEVAYRATLLRDRLGLGGSLPGGHLHTPVLEFAPENADPAEGRYTDPVLVANRRDITNQVKELLIAAATAPAPGA